MANILVVDDDKAILDLIENILSKSNHFIKKIDKIYCQCVKFTIFAEQIEIILIFEINTIRSGKITASIMKDRFVIYNQKYNIND